MPSYEYLSSIYDRFMDDYDYPGVIDRFTPYLVSTRARTVLDLACGTGTGTLALYDGGFNVTGLDLSAEMLMRAQEKALESHAKIRFLQEDMRSFSVRDRFDAVISMTDGFNYLLTETDLSAALDNIARHLNPGGWLMFDMSTLYKFRRLIGDSTFAETDEEAAYIWENFLDEATGTLTFDLNIFEKEESGSYTRHFETHRQRAYPPEILRRLLEKSGFDLVSLEGTHEDLAVADRLFYIARKSG